MSGYLNKVCLIGNVGADPDVRTLTNNSVVANFSLATTESWKDKNTGEKRERTEWHRVVVWNEGLVGVIENYVRKGQKLYVEGELQTRKWEDQNGVERYSTEVVLTGFGAKLLMLDRGGGGNRDPNGNAERPGNRVTSGRLDSDAQDDGSDADMTRVHDPRRGGYPTSRQMDDEIPF